MLAKRLFHLCLLVCILIVSVAIISHPVYAQDLQADQLLYIQDGNIYFLDPSTQQTTQFTSGKNYTKVKISRDNQWIIAELWTGSSAELEIISIRSGEVRDFGQVVWLKHSTPQMSPNGDKIVFRTGEAYLDQRTIVSDLSGNIVKIYNQRMDFPYWGDDNNSFYYFIENPRADIILEFYNTDIVTDETSIIYSFSWDEQFPFFPHDVFYQASSPNFVVAGSIGGGYDDYDLFFLRLDGNSEAHRLSYGACFYFDGLGDWSPDGQSFVFHQPTSSHYNWDQAVEIYHTSDSGGYLKFISKPAFYNPLWSPDGSKIALITSTGALAIYDVEKQEFETLTVDVSDKILDIDPGHCRGGSSGWEKNIRPFWSPSGTWLGYFYGDLQLINIKTENTIILDFHGKSDSIMWLPGENKSAISNVNQNESEPSLETETQEPQALKNEDPWIAYISPDKNIWLIRQNGTDKYQLTSDASKDETYIYYHNLKWSPNGNYLAFIRSDYRGSTEPTQSTLLMVPVGETEITTLANDVSGSFEWAPDSKWIVYSKSFTTKEIEGYLNKEIDTAYGLWKINLYTLTPEEFIPRKLEYPLMMPHLSPDGSKILFHMDQYFAWSNERLSIHTYPACLADLQDPNEFMVLDYGGLCDWSPNGDQFACTYEGAWQTLFIDEPCATDILSLSGEKQLTIPKGENSCDVRVSWSPDADYIAISTIIYDTESGNPDFGLDYVSLGDEINRFRLGTDIHGSFWSPDGSYLVFLIDSYSDTNERQGIYILEPNTGELKKIGDGEPRSWSSDSQWLITSNELINIISGEKEIFEENDEAAWQPFSLPPPPAIQDLHIELVNELEDGEDQNPFKLVWTHPESMAGLGSNERTITQYDIRYSETPITEENWNNANQISFYNPENSTDSVEFLVTKSSGNGIHANSFYHFAVKSVNSEGGWSDLSNVMQLIDTGFRVYPDGFSFENRGIRDLNEFNEQSMYKLFGESVCSPYSHIFNTSCAISLLADYWMKDAQQKMNPGRCFGMANISAFSFYEKSLIVDELAQHQVHMIDDEYSAWEFISRIQALSLASPSVEYLSINEIITPTFTLGLLQDSLSNKESVILSAMAINDEGNLWHHSVTPIALEENADGIWRIWVYDNNSPDAYTYYVIDTKENIWYSEKIARNKNTLSLYTYPTSMIQEKHFIDYWGNIKENITNIEVWKGGFPSLRIKNALGKRIGYYDGLFVSEIQGAYVTPIYAESINLEPMYYLPNNDVYDIVIDGSNYISETSESISIFDYQRAYRIENIRISNTTLDTLTIDPHNALLSYRSNEQKGIDLTFIEQTDNSERKIQLSNISLEPDSYIGINRNEDGEFFFSSSAFSIYNVMIYRISEKGEHRFSSENIEIDPGNSHIIDLENWDGSGKLKIQIDRNADGVVDETIKLRNDNEESQGFNQKRIAILVVFVGTIFLVIGGIGFLVVRKKSAV